LPPGGDHLLVHTSLVPTQHHHAPVSDHHRVLERGARRHACGHSMEWATPRRGPYLAPQQTQARRDQVMVEMRMHHVAVPVGERAVEHHWTYRAGVRMGEPLAAARPAPIKGWQLPGFDLVRAAVTVGAPYHDLLERRPAGHLEPDLHHRE